MCVHNNECIRDSKLNYVSPMNVLETIMYRPYSVHYCSQATLKKCSYCSIRHSLIQGTSLCFRHQYLTLTSPSFRQPTMYANYRPAGGGSMGSPTSTSPTTQMDETAAMGILKHLNRQELQELLDDDNKLSELINDLQQVGGLMQGRWGGGGGL